MDADHDRNLHVDGRPFDAFRQALFNLATVISRLTSRLGEVAVGLKACSVDSGMPPVADV